VKTTWWQVAHNLLALGVLLAGLWAGAVDHSYPAATFLLLLYMIMNQKDAT
jgi:hypothetical protein